MTSHDPDWKVKLLTPIRLERKLRNILKTAEDAI